MNPAGAPCAKLSAIGAQTIADDTKSTLNFLNQLISLNPPNLSLRQARILKPNYRISMLFRQNRQDGPIAKPADLDQVLHDKLTSEIDTVCYQLDAMHLKTFFSYDPQKPTIPLPEVLRVEIELVRQDMGFL
jgi:hypothetical protein